MKKAKFHELIENLELSRLTTKLEQAVLPSIRLITQPMSENQTTVGASKIGGLPDLPKHYSWPSVEGKPLTFLAQINLTESYAFDLDTCLPKNGWLYFFFDQEVYLQLILQNLPTKPSWKVLYYDDGLNDLQRTKLPVLPFGYTSTPSLYYAKREYPAHEVVFASELTLPDYSSYDPDSLQRLGITEPLSEAEEEAYYELQFILNYGKKRSEEDFSSIRPCHQLLGYATPMQWDVLQNCVRELNNEFNYGSTTQNNLTDEANKWQLLLQIDEDFSASIRWVGSGRIYFCIRKQDLAQKNFDNVWLVLQST